MILLLAGSALFQQLYPAQQIYVFASGPASIVAADLTGDGRPDLVTANRDSSNVSLLSSDAQGCLTPNLPVSVGAAPVAVVAGDWNRDGTIDLATADSGASTISLLIGSGGGGFLPLTTLALGASPAALLAADLDGDGNLDLATADPGTGTVTLLFGTGLGGFSSPSSLLVGASPRAIAAGNLNGDGLLDLVTVNTNSNSLSILLGVGSGAFTVAALPVPGGGPRAVAITDLNGDSLEDLVVAEQYSSGLTVLIGAGGGAFGPAASFTAGPQPVALAVRDLTGDGVLDVAIANFGSTTVTLLTGNGAGSFSASATLEVGPSPASLVAADLDGDGAGDLASALDLIVGGMVTLLRGTPSGSLAAAGSFATGPSPRIPLLGDLNADGHPDLVVARTGATPFAACFASAHPGNGAGGFGPPASVALGAGASLAAALADVNGDGVLDLVATPGGAVTASLSVFLGNGLGGFGPGPTKPTPFNNPALALADVDGDGTADALTANGGVGSLAVFKGSGSGSFGSPMTFPSGGPTPIPSLAVADVNGDGAPDAAIAEIPVPSMSALLGNGVGGFGAPATFALSGTPSHAAIGDLNWDGKPDLIAAVSTLSTDGYDLLPGDGAGGFGAASFGPFGVVALDPRSVAAGDMDGDGRSDFVTANRGSGNVFLRASASSCSPMASFASGIAPVFAAIGDPDEDGLPDLVVLDDGPAPRVLVLLHRALAPRGFVSFGSGTSGCAGALGLTPNAAPKVNSPSFAFLATNAPVNSLGFVLAGNAADVAGSDFLGLNLKLHIDVSHSTEIHVIDLRTDPAGAGFAPIAIPNSPFLVGLAYAAQAVAFENGGAGLTCSAAAFSLVSSKGLALVIGP